jgi:hypothetical protein
MSARLGAVRSFDQSARPIRSSEATDMPSERPVALLRDFHALEGEAQSHPYGGRLRAGALLTADGRLLRPLIRGCVAAICSGLSSWAWLCESLGASGIYGLVGALVMAALSVSSPGPGAEQHVVKE